MRLLLQTKLEIFTEEVIEKLLNYFPVSVTERICTCKIHQSRRERVIAYDLLVEYLKKENIFRELPVFEYGKYGKPKLLNYPDIKFNVSHCRTAVAVAVSKKEIGVDVESIRRYNPNLGQRIFNKDELNIIKSSPEPDREFTRLWTRKEAYVKYSGKGIENIEKLKQISVENNPQIVTAELYDNKGFVSICE